MKSFGATLFLVAIILLSVLPSLREEAARREIVQQAEDVASEIQNQPPQRSEQSGEVRTLNGPWRFSTQELQSLVNGMPPRRRHFYYTWSQNNGLEMTGSASGVDRNAWFVNSFLVGFKPFDTDTVWQPLATLALRKGYILDHELYGPRMAEIWQNSRQGFLYSRGDCEDHAIVLADWLIAMGHDARVVLGKHRDSGHAWVVLFKDGKEYLLEATTKRRPTSIRDFQLAALSPDYRPMYQFDRDHFWVNSGSEFTTKYRDAKWQKRSVFTRDRS